MSRSMKVFFTGRFWAAGFRDYAVFLQSKGARSLQSAQNPENPRRTPLNLL